MPKMAVYVEHHIYLTPFAYLQATHSRTLLHLSVFPDEIHGSRFTSHLFNFRPQQIYLLLV